MTLVINFILVLVLLCYFTYFFYVNIFISYHIVYFCLSKQIYLFPQNHLFPWPLVICPKIISPPIPSNIWSLLYIHVLNKYVTFINGTIPLFLRNELTETQIYIHLLIIQDSFQVYLNLNLFQKLHSTVTAKFKSITLQTAICPRPKVCVYVSRSFVDVHIKSSCLCVYKDTYYELYIFIYVKVYIYISIVLSSPRSTHNVSTVPKLLLDAPVMFPWSCSPPNTN